MENDLSQLLKRRSEIGDSMKELQTKLMALVKEREEIESKLTEKRDEYLKPLVDLDKLLNQRKNDVEDLDKNISQRKQALNTILEDAKKKLDEMIPFSAANVKRTRTD